MSTRITEDERDGLLALAQDLSVGLGHRLRSWALLLADKRHPVRLYCTTTMRSLCLDVGDVRVGVALSDETGTLASGLPTLRRVGSRKDVKAIKTLVREREAGEVVVGLSKTLAGEIGPQAEKVLAFVGDLRAALEVPVVTWDERFTTAMANKAMIEGGLSRQARKDSVDQVSAVLILQSYLDARPSAPKDE